MYMCIFTNRKKFVVRRLQTASTLKRHKKSKHQHVNSEISCRTCKDNYEKQDIHLNHIKNLILQKSHT